MMTPEQRIEEAHGLWELAVARVAGIAECTCIIHSESRIDVQGLLRIAVDDERASFANWQRVSKECGA